MGDQVLYCPLCCNATFESKQSLIEHLSIITSNLICPLCTTKLSSVEQLTDHLKHNNCEHTNSVRTVIYETNTQIEKDENALDNSNLKLELREDGNKVQNDNVDDSVSSQAVKMSSDSDVGKMYVELLSKQMMKPCLQTQELKLVKEDGQSRYVILTDEDSMLSQGVSIVTKQNNDGTISLTALKDEELEGSSIEEDADKSQEEIYSCNTCGVSFSSVLEHIQNYHNNQDVVVEEPMEESIPIEYETVQNEELLADKQQSRRMITETGDIIEAPLTENEDTEKSMNVVIPVKEETADKKGRGCTRQYNIKLEKFCNSLIKDIKPPDDKNGPYHNVVVKEMQTTEGNKMKVYNCMSCNIYVSSLSEFKQHPCKTLKYSCPQCPVAYENSKSLCAHMKVHKTRGDFVSDNNILSSLKFECEICSTIFLTSKSLKLHKRMHDPIKSRPIEPPVDTKIGNVASDHKFLCQICDKLIPIEYQTIHMNSHKGSNKMNCDICNKKFHSREYLEMHMSVHNIDKVVVGKQDKSLPYTCLYCNRKFARPHEKVKHERIHTGEKPHSCEICGKSFRVSYCLTLHMRTHTGARPYACPHCNKRFKAHSVYNHHLLTHSEVRAYKCPYCPKAFKTSVQLAGHKNSHTKPFSCQQCNRPFASLYAVRVHMEIHSRQNSLKFSCSLCGASYARAFALKDHVKQAHQQDLDASDRVSTATVSDLPSLLYRHYPTVTTLPSLLYRHYRTVTTVPSLPDVTTLPSLLYRHYSTVTTLPSLLYRHYSTVTTLPSLLYRHYSTVTTLPSLLYRHYSTVTTLPSLPYRHYPTVTTLPSLLYRHYSTVTTLPSLLTTLQLLPYRGYHTVICHTTAALPSLPFCQKLMLAPVKFFKQLLKEEDCMVQETDIDSDGINLNKDLPQEINELDIHTSELIVP